ncbi:hypothetical protein EDB19DRAFT_1685183, partial [Suillus lakei]
MCSRTQLFRSVSLGTGAILIFVVDVPSNSWNQTISVEWPSTSAVPLLRKHRVLIYLLTTAELSADLSSAENVDIQTGLFDALAPVLLAIGCVGYGTEKVNLANKKL